MTPSERTFGRRHRPASTLAADNYPKQDPVERGFNILAGIVLTGSGMLFLALLAYGIVRGAMEESEIPTPTSQKVTAEGPRHEIVTREAALPEPAACGATMAEFKQLATGMSIRDVERVIACAGTEVSRVEIEGYSTVMLIWPGTNSIVANMNATFNNGRLIAKAQLGLR